MINNEDIEKMREDLRNERNASREQPSETGTNLKRYGENSDRTIGSSVQVTRRESTTFRPVSGETRGSDQGESGAKRSAEKESIGIRQGRRRLGSPKSGNANNPEATRERSSAIGSIERIDEPFYRPDPDEKKPEAKKAENIVNKLVSKLPESSEDIPFFGSGKGKTFSKQETKDQYEAVKNAIEDYGEYIDLYMQKVEPGLPPIWSNFSDKELDFVTRALLRQAQVNPRAAVFTRTLLDGQDYIGAFVALIPRFVETLKFANRRMPRRLKKGQAREDTSR